MQPRLKRYYHHQSEGDALNFQPLPRLSEWAALSSVLFSKLRKVQLQRAWEWPMVTMALNNSYKTFWEVLKLSRFERFVITSQKNLSTFTNLSLIIFVETKFLYNRKYISSLYKSIKRSHSKSVIPLEDNQAKPQITTDASKSYASEHPTWWCREYRILCSFQKGNQTLGWNKMPLYNL